MTWERPGDKIAVVTSEFITGLDSQDHSFIVCRTCYSRSFNPNDVLQRYCGHCKRFHEDVTGYANRARHEANRAR